MKRLALVAPFMLLFVLGMTWLVHASGKAVLLITQKEAAMKDASPGLTEVCCPVNNGPAIKVISPALGETYRSPLKIIVRFMPKPGRPIDLSKLKVQCLKFFTINLTDRVLPYVSKWGIKMTKAKIPSGHYRIRVTIGDDKGGITRHVFTLNVK